MKQRLNNLLNELEFFLNHAPIEDECPDTANQMYSDMANLKNSIENYFDDLGDENGCGII